MPPPLRGSGSACAVSILTAVVMLLPAVSSALSSAGSSPGGALAPARDDFLSLLPKEGGGSTTDASLSPSSPMAAPLSSITLSVAGADPTGIGLTWSPTASMSFSTYAVQYSVSGTNGPWATAGLIANQSATAFGVDDLTPGATYAWQVVENDASQGPVTSGVVQRTQPAAADLNLTPLTAKSVQLNWTNDASYGASVTFVSYTVWEVEGGASPALVATDQAAGTLTQTVTGLVPSQSYEFFVRTTDCLDACASSAPRLATSVSNPVSVGPALALAANVSAAHLVVDVGQLNLFTCRPIGGQAPYTYAWDLGNGTFVDGGEIVATSYGSTGSITVTCRVTDGTNAQVTGDFTAAVAFAPALAASANRTMVETGLAVGFDCTPSLGVPPYAVDWAFGDGTSTPSGSTTHNYSHAGAYVATCLVTDATGTAASAYLRIQVAPALATGMTASSTAAVPGTTLSFSAQPANGSGVFVQYDWTFGDGADSTGAAPDVTHRFTTAGRFTVALEVVDTLGGTARATVPIDISNLSVTVAAHPSSVDTRTAVMFHATASGGAGGPYIFTWRFGDGTGLDGEYANHTYTTTGQVVPTLTVTDRLGASRNITLSAVTVVSPSTPPAFMPPVIIAILGVGIAIGAIGALIGERRRRVAAARSFSAVAGRVPDADPWRLVRGRRVCRICGHSNLAIRESCEACGATLPRRA